MLANPVLVRSMCGPGRIPGLPAVGRGAGLGIFPLGIVLPKGNMSQVAVLPVFIGLPALRHDLVAFVASRKFVAD